MRVPVIENYYDDGGLDRLLKKITNIEKPSTGIAITTDKERKDFIKVVEKIIRASQEYREYIKYLKENIDMNHCSFFTNVNNIRSNKVKIEIHHHPFDLFMIVETVLKKYIDNGLELNYFTIAEEVMKLHFQDKVGLIPLSKTVHDLYHFGKLFIPIQAVYGNFIAFITEYEPYINKEYIGILEELVRISRQIKMDGKQDLSILNVKYIYLEIDGMTFPTSVEDALKE